MTTAALCLSSLLVLFPFQTFAFDMKSLLFAPNATQHELVFDHDFPDPSLILAEDGWYYAYATQGFTETFFPNR